MMKKLKSLSKDNLPERLKKIDSEQEMNEIIGFLNGFEAGFTEAFKFINMTLEEHKSILDQYPVMGERKMAITQMQAKLKDILKAMEETYE